MSKPFKSLELEYLSLFNSLQIRSDKLDMLKWYRDKLLANRSVYESVAIKMNIPWYIIGAIHGRECSFNLSKCLHNGEPWDRKTTKVPAGRGPFDSFEESCIDALIYDGLAYVKDWTLARCLYECEKYNGFGYRNKHSEVLSPYLWAGSYHYQAGCYATDGRFSPKYIDDTIGVAVLIKDLANRGIITLSEYNTESQPAELPKKEVSKAPLPRPSILSRLRSWLSRH